jgi:Ferredoxin-like domain in Api92-like protein
MPNWCDNYVVLESTEANIQKIMDAVKSEQEQGLFSLFVPTPEPLLNTMAGCYAAGSKEQEKLEAKEKQNLETYGYKNWYDWACDTWGTKWDVVFNRDISVNQKSSTEVTLSFLSAWAPPVPFYDTLVADHGFIVTAYYSEAGMGFCGVYTTDKSTLETKDRCVNYEHDHKGRAVLARGGVNLVWDEAAVLDEVREFLQIDEEPWDDEDEYPIPAPETDNPLILQLHREGLLPDSFKEGT